MADDKIKEPHPHDVLSGRGNFVNYHDGNEYFRKLVRKHKVEYVNCPKQQKGKFSKMIVDEIKNRDPSGRFLKQNKDTKLWYNIGEKKALDKTRQALREGAPELMNNGKDRSSKEETGVDTAFNKPSHEQQQQLSSSEISMLQQSIMSLGNDSFNQSGTMMRHNPYNMQGIGLSPNMLASSMYGSPGGTSNNSNSSSRNIRNDNGRVGNRTGGMDLSQVIPPPQVHQTESNLLQQQQQQQQQRKEQEQQLQQLRFLQQQQRQQQEQQRQQQEQQRQQQEQQRQQQEQQRQQQEQQQLEQQQQQQQRQSRRNQFTSQQEQEILRNATAVMGNNFQKQQPQPTKMHMDQLRLNKLKEKRKLLEQQILHQRQLEILELKKLQSQQRTNDFQQNEQNQTQTSAGMRGALQNRLGEVYAGTEVMLEPTPMPGSEQNRMLPPSSLQSNGGSSSLDVTAELAGGTDSPTKDRRSGLVRENSLKMESIFENAGGVTTTNNNPKKNFNISASGMSMSATSLSLGFDEESELSALFDTSMKIEGAVARGYATALNDRGTRTPPRSPKTIRDRHGKITTVSGNLLGNSALLGMSLASLGAEKSNSSMSCDSSLSRLFDDTATPSK